MKVASEGLYIGECRVIAVCVSAKKVQLKIYPHNAPDVIYRCHYSGWAVCQYGAQILPLKNVNISVSSPDPNYNYYISC